jgi:hypothetical protein
MMLHLNHSLYYQLDISIWIIRIETPRRDRGRGKRRTVLCVDQDTAEWLQQITLKIIEQDRVVDLHSVI